MMKAICRAAFLALAVSAPAIAADHTMTLADHYSVAGTNPNGSHYAGTVDVNVISTTTFLVNWHISGGSSNGFGMRMGDTISVTYLLNGAPGLVIYRQQGDGFRGIWAIKGHDGSGTEVWTPQD